MMLETLKWLVPLIISFTGLIWAMRLGTLGITKSEIESCKKIISELKLELLEAKRELGLAKRELNELKDLNYDLYYKLYQSRQDKPPGPKTE